MKKVLPILIVLTILLVILVIIQKNRFKNSDGITIINLGNKILLSYVDIQKNEQISFVTERGDNMTGYQLLEILENMQINTQEIEGYIFRSLDGGTLELSKDDEAQFYLIFQDVLDKQDVRLVIPTDQFSQRWIKHIIEIELI